MVAKKPTVSPAPEKILAPVPDHYYTNIEGWFNFSGPYRVAAEAAAPGAVFVELGCWKGRSAAFMGVEILKSGKPITLHCVDNWLGFKSETDGHYWLNTAEAEALYREFERNLQPCVDAGLRLDIHIGDTAEAASQFKDGSVDFLWIDAGHEYDEVKRDIQAWLPKLRPGATIGGDDYPMDGVQKAVLELLDPVALHVENHWTTWSKVI